MNNEWHPCRYVDCKLEHDGSWVDGKWYEWEDCLLYTSDAADD